MVVEWEDVVIPIVIGAATAFAGYKFGCWKTRHDILAAKQIGLVEEFITLAHENLRYLPGAISRGEKPSAAADLAVLGKRAGLYVTQASAEAIEEFTSFYYSCFVGWGAPDKTVSFTEVKERLDELAGALRREIRGED